MKVESTRALQTGQQDKNGQNQLPSKLQIQTLTPITDHTFLLTRILCLHHIKLAFKYIWSLDYTKIYKYDSEYEPFIKTTKLRDVALHNNITRHKTSLLYQALKFQGWAIALIIFLTGLAGAASIVAIYYQQTLIKYIINQTTQQQWKWFGIVVGMIAFRFLVFNFATALTNNIAINIKVGIQNAFMRAIFFLGDKHEEFNLQRMKYHSIQSLIYGIIFFPYLLLSFFIIIGVIVLVFVIDGTYGFIFFGISLFCLIIQIIVLIFVQKKLQDTQQRKDEMTIQNKWMFRSLIPLIFDNLTQKIINKVMNNKVEELNTNRFTNGGYALSQFLNESAIVVSIIAYYGINNTLGNQGDLNNQNTYLTAVYLGMVYTPYKIFVYGLFVIVKAYQQYKMLMKNFEEINMNRVSDLFQGHLNETNTHSYPDNLGGCFNYSYQELDIQLKKKRTQNLQNDQSAHTFKIKRLQSNTFLELNAQKGEIIMVFCSISARNKAQKYMRQLINQIELHKSLASINSDHFILPESFKQNILFYTQYQPARFNEILQIVQLDHLIPQIDKISTENLNYRIAKFYSWHESRLQLARALYNNVDYLLIDKFSVIQDTVLLKNVLAYRRKQNKITIIANYWRFDIFDQADRIVVFEDEKKEIGTYQQFLKDKDSIIFKTKSTLKFEDQQVVKSQEIIQLNQNFINFIQKKQKFPELKQSVYFEFFSYAHKGAAIVVLLALLAPIAFKVYMNILVGRSSALFGQVVYPDYLIFGVIYLFLVLCRGLILSLYLRVASSQLFNKICEDHTHLTGDQILNVYKEKDQNIGTHFKNIDDNLLMNFQLGFSMTIEGFSSFIIIAIGQPIVLAMGIPLILVTIIINKIYSKIFRKLSQLRDHYQNQIKSFVIFCTTRNTAIFRYNKFQAIQNRYAELHRSNIIFNCNEMWLLSGMRMIGQFAILIGTIIFLIIMIKTQANQITNLFMVSLGCSLFISMNYSYRFSLRAIAVIQLQIASLSKCLYFQKNIKSQADENIQCRSQATQTVSEVQKIDFKIESIALGTKKCHQIDIILERGHRVVATTDSKILVTLPFYLLKRNVFGDDSFKGKIIINDTITNNFIIEGLFYIHSFSLLPISGNIFSACLLWRADLSKEQCQTLLEQFFNEVNIPQLFTIDTELDKMTNGLKQVLSVFRVIKLQKCKILILVSPFQNVDILSQVKIQKYLINNKNISILVSLSNIPQIIKLYPRQLVFKQGTFRADQGAVNTVIKNLFLKQD